MSGCHRHTTRTPSTSSETTATTTNTGGGSSTQPQHDAGEDADRHQPGQADLAPPVALAEEDGEHPDEHRGHHEHGRRDRQERRRHEPGPLQPFPTALGEGLAGALVPTRPRADHVVVEDHHQQHGQGDHPDQAPGRPDGERYRARQSPIHRHPFRLGSAHARPRARSCHQVQGGPLRPREAGAASSSCQTPSTPPPWPPRRSAARSGAIANSLLFDAAGSPVLILTSGAHRVDTAATAARDRRTRAEAGDARVRPASTPAR